jgi:hypothetical protein
MKRFRKIEKTRKCYFTDAGSSVVKTVYQIRQQSQQECEDLEIGGLHGWEEEKALRQVNFEG